LLVLLQSGSETRLFEAPSARRPLELITAFAAKQATHRHWGGPSYSPKVRIVVWSMV
jgi:hypothetical protein